MSDGQYVCEHVYEDTGQRCGQEFASGRALGIHKASHDREKVACPKCGRRVMYLETHLKKAHSEDTKKLLEGISSALEELESARTEIERLTRENISLRRQLAAA